MRIAALVFAVVFPVTTFAANEPAAEPQNEFQALDWHFGPSTEKIGSQAVIAIGEDMAFLNDKETMKFLRLTGNIPTPDHYVVVSSKGNWWAIFSFNPIGYVKDDEKIDAAALLADLKSNDGPANEERARLGLEPLYTDGWHVPPHYDVATRRLEWGLRLRAKEGAVLNYTVRLLGRSGVMNATLVSSPETLDADVKSFKAALKGYEFVSGQRYTEFQPGDKVAEYGLAALVAGGAAAVAAKSGFLAKFWKALVVGAFAAFAAIGKFLKGLTGKRD